MATISRNCGVRYSIFTKTSFEAAHFLPDYDGDCRKMHGHSYKVEAGLVFNSLDIDKGMNLDMATLRGWLKEICAEFDHTVLNSVDKFSKVPPTAENIARIIGLDLIEYADDYFLKTQPVLTTNDIMPQQAIVRVHETKDNNAEVVIDFFMR